ncbi:MAG: hypothetical protein R3362_10855 [Rhodothermales bacterium]|nr:hypothetical protein [Rhodothermales bacterium]
MADQVERWVQRFERESPVGKVKLVGGTAARLAANLIDRALDQAAFTVTEAERAFRSELDPNVEDAKVIEEWDEERERRR